MPPSKKTIEAAADLVRSGKYEVTPTTTVRFGQWKTTIGEQIAECTCPAGRHGTTCKHVIAARGIVANL